MAGTLFIVATPIGNLDDISARAIRVLGEVALIAAEDTRRTSHLLQRFGLTTRCTSFHEHNAKSKAPELLARLMGGESVALVTDAGTPGISDPGPELVRLARAQAIPVVPIPGASAVTTALSVCGFAGDAFIFLGFPPSKGTSRRAWLDRCALIRTIAPLIVFYEAPHRIQQTLDELFNRLGNVPLFIGRELTKMHEELIFGDLAKTRPTQGLGEFVCVLDIGQSTEVVGDLVKPSSGAIAEEFMVLTRTDGLRRRQAITTLSRKHGLSAREVYAMVEAAKGSSV